MAPEETLTDEARKALNAAVDEQAMFSALEQDEASLSDGDLEAIFGIVSELTGEPLESSPEARKRVGVIRRNMQRLLKDNGDLVQSMVLQWAGTVCGKIETLLTEPSEEAKRLNSLISRDFTRFADRPMSMIDGITLLLQKNKEAIHSSTIKMIMKNFKRIYSPKRNRPNRINIQKVNAFLTQLAIYSNQCSGIFTAEQIAICFAGLEELDDRYAENPFMPSMTYKLENTPYEEFTWADIEMIFKSLKRFDKDDIPTKLLDTVAEIIEVLVMKDSEVSQTKLEYIFKHISEYDLIIEIPSGVYHGIAQVLDKQKTTINGRLYKSRINAHSFKTILGSLRNQPPNDGIKLLIAVVADKISKLEQNEYTCEDIGEGLAGLKHQNETTVPTILMETLALKLSQTDSKLTNKSIHDIFKGLARLSELSIPPVMFTELRKKFEDTDIDLDDESIGCILFSLQNIKPQAIPPSFLDVVLDKIGKHKGKLSVWTITRGITGITNRTNSKHFKYIEEYLLGKLEEHKDSEFDEIEMIGLMRAMNIGGILIPKWLIEKYTDMVDEIDKDPTQLEEYVLSYFNSVHPELEVELNVHRGGFELDILIKNFNINIELDGLHHKHQREKDQTRDFYLMRQGIRVIRIDLEEIEFKARELYEALEAIEF